MLISTSENTIIEAWGVDFSESVYDGVDGVMISCMLPTTFKSDEPFVEVGFLPIGGKQQAKAAAVQLKRLSIRGGYLDCTELDNFVDLLNGNVFPAEENNFSANLDKVMNSKSGIESEIIPLREFRVV